MKFYAYADIYGESLADQINATLNGVRSWANLTEIGAVMHTSPLTDFDAWISNEAQASNWKNVLSVKRLSEQAGYSSKAIDAKTKLALSNIPMFSKCPLPITDAQGRGYFWPWDRRVLYGYGYARELGHETDRWNATSGFSALKDTRDLHGSAFYRCNPDTAIADSMFGTRWHESGSLMDCFFIFDQLGVKGARNYAIQEWSWLNNMLWSLTYFDYAPLWPGYEFSGMDVFPNVSKLQVTGTGLEKWDRVVTDVQSRYLSSLWASPQWSETYRVTKHHSVNLERRLDGTLTAWIMLNAFYNRFDHDNQAKMKDMLEGNGVTQAWVGLNESDLRQAGSNRYRITSSLDYSDAGTAQAALCMFLMGICPQGGGGLAIPLISDRHVCHACLNYRHFEFDYGGRTIKIPVWGGAILGFGYGGTSEAVHFSETGIYQVSFARDWSSVSQVEKISGLYPTERYLSPLS